MAGAFERLLQELTTRGVRFVVIGVAGANYFATNAGTLFTTEDRDLFLPPDPDNMLRAWEACEAAGLTLWCGDEPLDIPRDRFLAEAIAARRLLQIAVAHTRPSQLHARHCTCVHGSESRATREHTRSRCVAGELCGICDRSPYFVKLRFK